MQVASIHQAKTHLSNLIKKAQSGEEVIICKAGKPTVKLVKYDSIETPRTPGIWKGKIKISKDFDELPPVLLAAFKEEK